MVSTAGECWQWEWKSKNLKIGGGNTWWGRQQDERSEGEQAEVVHTKISAEPTAGQRSCEDLYERVIEGEEAGVEDSTGEPDQAGMDDYQTEEVKPITQNKTGESRTTIGVCHLLPTLRLRWKTESPRNQKLRRVWCNMMKNQWWRKHSQNKTVTYDNDWKVFLREFSIYFLSHNKPVAQNKASSRCILTKRLITRPKNIWNNS